MSLSPGTKLGPFEILAPIGAGGMGEAYPKVGRRKAKGERIKRGA